MPRAADAVTRIDHAVGRALAGVPRVLLAVSGGRDSMVLLEAARLAAPGRIVVATYDHGTGRAARDAVSLVARTAMGLGVPVVIGRSGRRTTREAEWREARWTFLRDAAWHEGAIVATAHTRDDQLETVVIRALRDAGARGLAGLYAASDVLRPLLGVDRADVAAYAAARGVEYADDPSNRSRAHLRNRVRLDLIPALARVRPSFPSEMLALSRRAARWREQMDGIVDAMNVETVSPDTIRIASDSLQGYDAEALRVLWPAIAARAGVVLDRRGTERAAAFTTDEARARGKGRVIQLSGGAEIERVRDAYLLRRR